MNTNHESTEERPVHTASEQTAYWRGFEQAQLNVQHSASLRPIPASPVATERAQDWGAIDAAVTEYLDGYEMEGDGGYYVPSKRERVLLDDAIASLLADDKFMALLTSRRAPAAGDALDAALGAAIYRACSELPFGYSIELRLEDGYGGARLLDPEDGEIDLDDQNERDLAQEINAGIDAAIAQQSQRKEV